MDKGILLKTEHALLFIIWNEVNFEFFIVKEAGIDRLKLATKT